MKKTKLFKKLFIPSILSLLVLAFSGRAQTGKGVAITGELKQWHKVTLTFDGPETGEDDAFSPFLNYRLIVTFSNGKQTLSVPGYFAADGNAAHSGATSGHKWRCHFVPFSTGEWKWAASFREGFKVAINDFPMAGEPMAFDGASGSFTISASDKQAPDFRTQGMLQYVGEHYLKFAGSQKYFLKGGADSPETLLAYGEFDGTRDKGGIPLPALENGLHYYKPHINDWREGDPTWKNGKGKGLIGAINYLSSKGMNSVYFLTMNVNGDGNDVWPWIDPWTHYVFDVSKLDQWEIVFSHMERMGIMLHIVTQETENDNILDGGKLGDTRKLYFRELIARFGHHLAITWNLGEENNNSAESIKAFSDYIAGYDPYHHPIVVHNGIYKEEVKFRPLLGHQTFHGPSLQVMPWIRTHDQIKIWREESAKTGHPWMVCLDEFGPADRGTLTDQEDYWHDHERKDILWASYMAGAAGVEWYFGWQNDGSTSDLANEDWRNREHMWEQTRYALDFFHQYIPFWEMVSADELIASPTDYCFAKAGEVYTIFLRNGGTTRVNLSDVKSSFEVKWYNPRTGGELQDGSVKSLKGGDWKEVGTAPNDQEKDWVVLIQRKK
ncbi:DUF5060 domain-containing protein [Flexithrix dorotheae]|uniref:DUF5060 domain-containing protein n=1 Tax=Flexithrix dorotheae TaxID=70993 RepID=UPI0003802D94|nr:DUF5060 domain-containing protein [Flexithrix dorotheae]